MTSGFESLKFLRERHMSADSYLHVLLAASARGLVRDAAWLDSAACTPDDGDKFFSDGKKSAPDALALCHDCSVRAECLDFALANDERFGVWGGTTPEQRRRLMRRGTRRLDSGEYGGGRPPAA